MFANKLFATVVCGLSLALGACAYGADEASPAVGEQSSELVAAEARLEESARLPVNELAAKDQLQKAGELPAFAARGLDHAEIPSFEVKGQRLSNPAGEIADAKLGENAFDVAPDPAIQGAVRARTTIEAEIVHELEMAQPTIIEYSATTTLTPAGNPCALCAR